jgi:hypothetical protein
MRILSAIIQVSTRPMADIGQEGTLSDALERDELGLNRRGIPEAGKI